MNIRTYARSFAGGEVTPEFYGRIDDAKYQTGLATCRNFIPLPHGPVANRPGFHYVAEVKDSARMTRLIPFSYSTTQTMVLELGHEYIRFHTEGATLLQGSPAAHKASATVTISFASPGVVTWNSHGLAADTPVRFTTTGALPTGLSTGTTYYVRNPGANTFEVALTAGGTSINTTGAGSGTHTGHRYYEVGDLVSSSGTNYYCILAHANQAPPNATYWYAQPAGGQYEIPSPYVEDDLFDIHFVQSADVMTLVHPGYIPRELRRYGATDWVLDILLFASQLSPPDNVAAVATPGATPGTPSLQTYVVSSVSADGKDESTYSAIATCNNNLFDDDAYNTISWDAADGAGRYYVYKLSNGQYGYIGQTVNTSFVDDNIAADISVVPPEINDPFLGVNNYPGAVSYFEQRRAFGGTLNAPQTLWMTRSGTESNLNYSIPTRDDDSIQFRIAAREANTIRHIVPLQEMILLTSSAEWRVTSINTDAITPTSISVKPQSYVGANNVQPIIVNNNLLFAAARGGHVRELGYASNVGGYVTGDLSLRAPHLFDNLEVVDMAFAKAPQQIVWMVSSNGKLLGLTYVPEQAIGAWHQHDTDGEFESCCVVSEGSEDRLYVVVKRTIDGNVVRYIERIASRQFEALADCFFVDSGLSYDGTNTGATTMTVSGGTSWDSDETLTLTASVGSFVYPATTDVGDEVVLTDADGNQYRLEVESTSSTTVATVRTDKLIVASLRNAATTSWAWAREAFSGLNHLEGETVSILADGAVHPQRTVASGAVTLDRPATVVHIGLPIEADIKTLPLAFEVEGYGQGRVKNVNKVWLRVYRSSGIFVGPDEDQLVEAKQRTTEPYGSPPELKSQEVEVMVKPSWGDSASVFVRQSDPLPLTIVSMTLDVSVGS